ncbi:hypothetical protein B0H15DRAFT_850541 [Mycena belliarum]|uniref:Uncharacterized protein n=1 Tax=Mycena belliarum TaxID=1033014 RepID=A0AAD6U3D8_9AGAR|nr:hypothetical protein B0H15DRAFT_850541 [Mycena belliae]
MARLSSLFFGLLAALLVSAAPAPSDLEERNLLGEIINALGIGLVTQINATITLETLSDNTLSIVFQAQNPLIFELTIDRVSSSAGINNTEYATFDHTFATPVVVPALGKASSGVVPNVTLTKGATASLDIIPLGYLDLLDVDVHIRALTIKGKLGIPLVLSDLHQKNVTTTYTLDLA